jgi:DNA mismatch repair protein MutL
MGFVSNPQEQRSSRDAQYLFINRRFVRDQLIGRALSEAYRSMMPSGTYPAAVLFINVSPVEVDVNVHPAKTEVRFLHEGAVLAFVRDAVSNALRTTQPITQIPSAIRSNEEIRGAVEEQRGAGEEKGEPAYRSAYESDYKSRDVSAIQRPDRSADAGTTANGSSQFSNDARTSPEEGMLESATKPAAGVEDEAGCSTHSMTSELTGEATSIEPGVLPGLGHGIKPLGQIRDSYIVATDEEGLLLVDQHVAHERILFEQFRDGRLSRNAGLQPLLIPATLDLSPAEVEAFAIVQGELENIGIETMQLSGRTVAIKTAPAGLAASDVRAVVREVLAVVERERRSFTVEHIRDQIAAELGCKAAIKVNMPLTAEKMQWLIDELMKTQNPMTCPHGRPIMMRMGLRDIERGFKRPV